jgi:hypothetical protein
MTSPDFTAEAHSLEGTLCRTSRRTSTTARATWHQYPFILKPDVGQRGVGVKPSAHRTVCDLPGTNRGSACRPTIRLGPTSRYLLLPLPASATRTHLRYHRKIFPTVAGDGRHTLEELVWLDPRLDLSRKISTTTWQSARRSAAAGEFVKPSKRETTPRRIFQDGGRLWSDELERCIDEISQKLDGFTSPIRHSLLLRG